jgi:hypothetical protein
MAFLKPPSACQIAERRSQMAVQLDIERLPPALGNEAAMIFADLYGALLIQYTSINRVLTRSIVLRVMPMTR